MRLVNTTTLRLEAFPDEGEINYAILSHRWEEDEVLFEHLSSEWDSQNELSQMKGFQKISMCCGQAKRDGLKYVWVDTCCIEKSSSAELQEAINSMYRWYTKAVVCYAYLSDVVCPDPACAQFRASQWFKRGWTLQELIAPVKVEFYDRGWAPLGTRCHLADDINSATGIPISILQKGFQIEGFEMEEKPSTAQIMSWARGRKTTRLEDRAYSLMGLFDVNMPMLYGEGDRAFRRLQEEIIRNTHDQSIFAWEGVEDGNPGLLARSPDNFPQMRQGRAVITRRGPHTITNEGISLTVELRLWVPQIYLAILNCIYVPDNPEEKVQLVGIFLRKLDRKGRYARAKCRNRDLWRSGEEIYGNLLSSSDSSQNDEIESINVVKRLDSRLEKSVVSVTLPFYGFQICVLWRDHPSNADVFRASLASFDQTTRQLGLSDGVCGVAGEVVVMQSPSSRTPIRIKLAFYKNFVPHFIIYHGHPFKSEAGWWIGSSGWQAAKMNWEDYDGLSDTTSLVILRGRRGGASFDIGDHFCLKDNMIVLRPSPDDCDIEFWTFPFSSTIIDAVLVTKDQEAGVKYKTRIKVIGPKFGEESAPWMVYIYPDWESKGKEEDLIPVSDLFGSKDKNKVTPNAKDKSQP